MTEQGPKGHRAKKSLGQNFLADGNIARKIVAALGLRREDAVLEIGPGRGTLTSILAEEDTRRFLAIEKDRELAPDLAARFPNLEVHEGDVLDFDWTSLCPGPWKVVGNLPYNIASKLIWDLVTRPCWDRAVFMVQHEVAERLAAAPGCGDYGALTVWVQNHARVEYLFKVPPHVFHPAPKVDSAVVRLTPLPMEERAACPQHLGDFAKQCFQSRRKQLRNALRSHWGPALEAWFEERAIPLTSRPENITILEFRELAEWLGRAERDA